MLDAKNAKTRANLVSVILAGGLISTLALLVLRVGPPTVWAHVVPQPCDFTTGGGFVFKDDGNRVNFGIVGGCKNEGFFGHVNVVDHSFDPPGHLNDARERTQRRRSLGRAAKGSAAAAQQIDPALPRARS